jgi:hypothetical protein
MKCSFFPWWNFVELETLTTTVVGDSGPRVDTVPVSVKLNAPIDATYPTSVTPGMITLVASRVALPDGEPVARTTSPSWMSEKNPWRWPKSEITVVAVTFTVTVEGVDVSVEVVPVKVKLDEPSDATVPVTETDSWWRPPWPHPL